MLQEKGEMRDHTRVYSNTWSLSAQPNRKIQSIGLIKENIPSLDLALNLFTLKAHI
jgi:hypothetical protein